MNRIARPVVVTCPQRFPDGVAPEDAYRVRTWRGRTWGRLGWRLQVDLLSAWAEYGDQTVIGRRPWRRPWFRWQHEALEFGVMLARAIHRDEAPHLPLVVHIGTRVAIDERVEADGPS